MQPWLSIFFTLVILGVVLWLINTFLPMDARIKQLINVLAVIFIVFWLLSLVLGFRFPLLR